MSIDGSKANDMVTTAAGRVRDRDDAAFARGRVMWEVHGPDGELKASGEDANIITDIGARMYWEKGAAPSGVTPPNSPTGMKLGNQVAPTAAAKTGTGAALQAYVTNSHQAFDAGFPTSTQPGGVGTDRIVTYKCTFAAGKATSATNPITEAVIVVDTLADATSTAANTAHRVILGSPATKGASDTLTITWTSTLAY